MIDTIIRYGLEATNKAGIKTLGYPGLWAMDNKEVRAIENYFSTQGD